MTENKNARGGRQSSIRRKTVHWLPDAPEYIQGLAPSECAGEKNHFSRNDPSDGAEFHYGAAIRDTFR